MSACAVAGVLSAVVLAAAPGAGADDGTTTDTNATVTGTTTGSTTPAPPTDTTPTVPVPKPRPKPKPAAPRLIAAGVTVGGTLVGGRFDKLLALTEKSTEQEFGPGAIKCGSRARRGDRPRERTRFTRVLPPPIELVNWEELEGNGKSKPKLYEE